MDFEKGNRYLLVNVDSNMDNPLHDTMIGRICELRQFHLGSNGMFKVQMDDGMHLISTSEVQDVDASDFANDITVTTCNSVYTFTKVGSVFEYDEENEDENAFEDS